MHVKCDATVQWHLSFKFRKSASQIKVGNILPTPSPVFPVSFPSENESFPQSESHATQNCELFMPYVSSVILSPCKTDCWHCTAALVTSEIVRSVTLVSSPYHWTFEMLWVVYWLTIIALVLFVTWLLVLQPVRKAKQAAKVYLRILIWYTKTNPIT